LCARLAQCAADCDVNHKRGSCEDVLHSDPHELAAERQSSILKVSVDLIAYQARGAMKEVGLRSNEEIADI